MAEDFTARFEALAQKPINEQTKYFLKEFVLDFQGKFEEVLDIAEEFRTYVPAGKKETAGTVDEFQAHIFLEKRGETLTVKALRDYLKQVHLGAHHPVCVLEYLLWRYNKSAAELFAPPSDAVPPELLRQMEEAIEAYQTSIRVQREREEEVKRLEAEASSGKRTLQSVHAKNKAEDLKGQEFNQKFKEMQALKKKKEMEKAVAEAKNGEWLEKEKLRQLEEEKKRVEEEKKKKEAEERKRKEESRARLKAKASLWQ